MFTKLTILPKNPDILKDIFNQSSKIHKNHSLLSVFKLITDGGLLFAENEEWKRKRKIISSVFHYEFINDMIPLIDLSAKE